MSAIIEFGFNAAPVFSGVNRLETELRGLEKSVGRMGSSFGNAISGILPALSFGAAVAGIRSTMTSMDDLVDASLRLNETTEVVQRVSHASRILASVDIDGLSKGFLRLEKSLGETDNKAAADALADLGLTASKLISLPLDQKMLAFADAFQEARARGTGYSDIMDLLGKQAGQLIPLFESGRGAIEELFAGAPVVLDATVQRLAAANDQLDTWINTLKVGATETIGTTLTLAETLQRLAGGLVGGRGIGEINAEIQAENQARIDAAAAADEKIAARRKFAAASTAAAAAAAAQDKSSTDAFKDTEKLIASQQRLDAQKRAAGLDEMTTAQRIATLRVEAQNAAAEEAALRADFAPDAEKIITAESRKVALQVELNRLQKQYASDKEREIEAAARAAEQKANEAKQAAAAAATQRNVVVDTELEFKLLQAKAGGRQREVDAIERQQRVLELSRRFESQNKLDPQAAMALALQFAGLEDRAQKRPGGSADGDRGGNKIMGYKPGQAWTGAKLSAAASRSGMGGSAGRRGFGTLADYDAMQRSPSAWQTLQKGPSQWDMLQGQHGANAAREAPAAAARDGDTFLEKLLSKLPPALAAALMAG